jgi:hypothetical protein
MIGKIIRRLPVAAGSRRRSFCRHAAQHRQGVRETSRSSMRCRQSIAVGQADANASRSAAYLFIPATYPNERIWFTSTGVVYGVPGRL